MLEKKPGSVSRRDFFKRGAAVGASATALSGQAPAQARRGQIRFDQVVAGAGASACRPQSWRATRVATVIVIDSNHDIGGHAMLSGGRIPLGGGTKLQKKFGITDSADQVYVDHTNHRNRNIASATAS